MKIYVLEEYNTGRTACISEDINIIRKQMCNKDFFNPEYKELAENCTCVMEVSEDEAQFFDVEGLTKRVESEYGVYYTRQ